MSGIRTIGVVGAGQMGNGIAHVAALAGYDVIMTDVDTGALERGMATIRKNVARQVSKGSLTQEQADVSLARIRTGTSLADLADVDLAIEAATERVNLKFQIFEELSRVTRPDAILATNTSSISITSIAAHTAHPDQVIGMHFMNPVPLMKLVEIIRGLATSDATFDTTMQVCAQMNKTTVVARDMPGFIVNRILMPYINEAAYALYENLGSVADIDAGMKLGTNVPMGPLELADFIGLDTCLAIMEVLHTGLGDTKYRPCPLLRKYVEAGWLGRKSGRGFYTYGGK